MNISRRFRGAMLVVAAVGMAACADDDDAGVDTAGPATTEVSGKTVAPAVPPATTAATPQTTPETTPETTGPASTTPADTNPVTPSEYDFSAVDPIVTQFVADNGLNGAGLIVVDREDGVVHEDYWGEFSADRVSFIASSSKSLTAGVLLRLADDGLLDVDAPIASYVDWGSGNPDITVAQLLSNSSGLPGLLEFSGIPSYGCQFMVAGDIEACAEQIFTTTDDDTSVVPPDTMFRYGGAQWQVAGGVAEAVSGKSWAELVTEIYVEPCDLDVLGYNNHFTQFEPGGFTYPADFTGDPSSLAPTDNPNMEGGAYSTTGDYAQLLLMQLRDGMCGDTQVLSTDALARLHSDRLADLYGPASGDAYGMGWWVEDGRITDTGAYGSVPWLDLANGHGAFLVIEADATTGVQLATQLYGPVAAAIAAADQT